MLFDFFQKLLESGWGAFVAGLAISLIFPGILSLLRVILGRLTRFSIKLGDSEYEVRIQRVAEDVERIKTEIEHLRRSPRVVILYPMSQLEFARKLADDLRERAVGVWLATDIVRPGDSLTRSVLEAVDRAQWVIVILGQELASSPTLQSEVALALAAERSRGRPFVVPVRPPNGVMPSELADRLYADFSKDYQSGLMSLLNGIRRQTSRLPEAG